MEAGVQIRKGAEVIQTLDQWLDVAGPKDVDKQWKEGRSAMESAIAWLEAPGSLPPEISTLLHSHPDFGVVSVEWIEPEAPIRFDSHSGPRHADIAVSARDANGAIAVTLEAKADEPFDQRLADVLEDSLERLIANAESGGFVRARDLARALLPPLSDKQASLGTLRYQLFTGVAGTLALAEREKAARAVFIVHEIVTNQTSRQKLNANHKDYSAFVRRLTGMKDLEVMPETLYGPIRVPGAPLFQSPAALYIGKTARTKGEPQP